MIVENNISNKERLYRNFVNMVKAYSPKTDEKDIRVEKTSKGNWKVFDASGKRICLVSKSILNDEVVADYNVTKCNCED